MERFALSRPLETHWRPATCEEVDCPHYLFGWEIRLDPDDALFEALRADIRRSGRRYREEGTEDGMRRFVFEAGQRCFAEHRLPLDRDPVYTHVRPSGQLIRHASWESWRDEFMERAWRAGRLTNA